MRRKYTYKIVPLGLDPRHVAQNIERQREQGWTLISTYLDQNRNITEPEPSVCGVFEFWVKVKSGRLRP